MIKHPLVKNKKELNCYTHIECATGDGQLVNVACSTDKEEQEQIKKVFELIKFVREPVSHKVELSHGGYGRYTRYDIVQHKYAGGGPGYFETLEIKDPPDGRCGFVVYKYRLSESGFAEYETKEDAIQAWESIWNGIRDYKKHKGFLRYVECNGLDPWFYAVGDESLMGDYVFPSVFGEHPVYKPLKKFIVKDCAYGLPTIKTCMGAITYEQDNYNMYGSDRKKTTHIKVYWDDGSLWEGYENGGDKPIPLNHETLWINEAIEEFKKVLSGNKQSVEIEFLDGTKFRGKIHKSYNAKNTPGLYGITIKYKKNGKEIIKSGKCNFNPTFDCPTLESRIEHDCVKMEYELLEVVSCVREKKVNGKIEWNGVYNMKRTSVAAEGDSTCSEGKDCRG